MKILKHLVYGLYIHPIFYIGGGLIIGLFVISFFLPFLYVPAQILLLLWFLLFVADILLLFTPSHTFEANREVAAKLSNGDYNKVTIRSKSYYPFSIKIEIVDEIPAEFQIRNFYILKKLTPNGTDTSQYRLRPNFRGEVEFGDLHIYITSPLKLIKRKFTFDQNRTVAVYPSFIQMNKYELIAFSPKLNQYGIKKVRRIGHTLEFEKIKDYVAGDDIRTINWKATAKTGKLMINQYQDEQSQSVYCIVDKGRVMKMPFDDLTLLDYAINACLVISNIILRKHDFAGVFSFSRKVENFVPADKRTSQLKLITEALYNIKTDFAESDFGRLYTEIKQKITHRSMLLLFTNFESLDALNRQLLYLQSMAKNHLLIVILFQNTELEKLTSEDAHDTRSIINKVLAEQFIYEKKLIISELKKLGIHCILTRPEQLTIDTINKYLELKARGSF